MMNQSLQEELQYVEQAANAIAAALPPAEIAIVLGSGLGDLANNMLDAVALDYADIPGFPAPTVLGHSGRLICGQINQRRIYALSGRFHYYEGHDPYTVVRPMRVLHQLGCKKVILTNAAGGVNPQFRPGDLMLIRDHLNLTGYNPLRGENNDSWGTRFPDMTEMYDKEYGDMAVAAAAEMGFELKEGVYCGLAGPTFETPAEIRMLHLLGADAVGMSTVPEAIAACHMGMRLLAISCITNMAAGISKKPLTHQEVTETGKMVEKRFSFLLNKIMSRI
jgi:purine-nucleoside phosphorylase